MLKNIKQEILANADPTRARNLARYFKTGKGQYAQGDKFLGLTVPQSRSIVKKYTNLPLIDIRRLLQSKIHEERLIALLILVHQFEKANNKDRKAIYNFYLKNTKYINNWDLVDLSAHKIVGAYLLDKDRKILIKLAKSQDLWEKRISIISTFTFIYHDQLEDSIKIAQILLNDKHDLIHKAVGWVLREVGKKDQTVLVSFLTENIRQLPRTTLRYAIERFPEPLRQKYLKL